MTLASLGAGFLILLGWFLGVVSVLAGVVVVRITGVPTQAKRAANTSTRVN